MNNLNANEVKALEVICHDCDDLEGEGFTRLVDIARALLAEFENAQVAGGYIAQLSTKGFIDVDLEEGEVWVSRDVYRQYSANK